MKAPSSAAEFRPDIEGLRGIAILLVLLFHAGLPWTPGGFVGVDVFFVISGFLITGKLWRESQQPGGLNITRFYAWRIRRLLPAALVFNRSVAVPGGKATRCLGGKLLPVQLESERRFDPFLLGQEIAEVSLGVRTGEVELYSQPFIPSVG